MTDYLTDFVQESEERITELNNALLTLEQDPGDEEAMEQIFRIAHTLKGNCGAMGLESASDLAHAIEDLLDAVRRGDIEVTPELMDVVFDAVDELETMIDEVAADGEIDTDPSATIEAVREYLEGDTTPTGLRSPTPAEIDEICSRFAPPTDDDRDVYLARLEIAEREGVNNGKLVVDALIDAFELMGTDPARDRIEAGEYDRGFDAVFATAVGEAAIASGLEPVEEVDDFEIVDVDDRFEAAPAADPDDVTAEDISSADAQDLEVDELLDEFDEFDNLDEMVEDVEDEELDAFEDMGEAGSFDDLLDEEDVAELEAEPGQPPADGEADATAGGADAESADSAADDGDEVDDASAVFDELKDEVEMVGFDELQDELAELEFDEFDEDEEVGMDELLGEEADDEAFLEGEEPAESAVDDVLVDAEADADDEPEADDGADAAAAEGTADTDAIAAPAPDDLESDEPSLGPGDESTDDEPATDASEPESPDDIEAEAADPDESASTPGTAASPESDEAPTEPASTEAGEPETAAEPDESGTALEGATDPDGTAAPDADETDLETAATDRADDVSVESDDAPADDAGVTDADTEPALEDDASDEAATVDAEDGAPTDRSGDLETGTDDGTDLEEADTIDDGVDADDDIEADDSVDADDGLETADADSGAADADAETGAAADEFGAADGFEPSAGFDDDLETADEDPFGDESTDAAADSFGVDDEFEASADSVDLEDGDDGFGGGLDDDIDDGLDDAFGDTDDIDDVFGDTDEFDVGTDFGSSADESGTETDPTADSSFGDDADDGEDEDDVVRTVEEPEFEIPDVEVPDTDVRPDADDEADEIQSVRVDVEQVDSLLNLVEGLVTSRVRLRHAAEAEDGNDALETELDALSDLTTDLQETVMDIRLVPLRTVTNRLPRVVRDISREQDKEVAFEMTGEDVELDRSILDRIGDPLIHLVRNAVDHGIEPPEEREAADKPREGSVEVRADRESDRVTITVADDGGGLDPDRLRDEAVEADVLEPEVAADLPDEDAYDLIFHPGLSTAEEVTDVSGRGVGMDVVKRTVEDLDGTVSIDSEAGEGTTVTMELPVTVAIDEILFVESGGEEFGVPTEAVRDIEPAAAIETAGGESILPGEDGDYPVVSLADVLETPAAGANGDGMVVRIRDDVREVALHCDRVRGQQEVVVKPFEGFMSGVPGISGATVRGRGEVVNILDVTTL